MNAECRIEKLLSKLDETDCNYQEHAAIYQAVLMLANFCDDDCKRYGACLRWRDECAKLIAD